MFKTCPTCAGRTCNQGWCHRCGPCFPHRIAIGGGTMSDDIPDED